MRIDENGIHDVPVLEFVPIVRCKDCIHQKPACIDTKTGEFSDVRYCYCHHMFHSENYYCADGKVTETNMNSRLLMFQKSAEKDFCSIWEEKGYENL